MSSQFTDSKGRAWLVEFTIGRINRIRSLTGLHLGEPNALLRTVDGQEDGQPLIVVLSSDLLLLGNVIYAIIKDQADEKEVTQEDFLDSLSSTACDAALSSFWEEYRNFFQRMPHFEASKIVLEVMNAAEEAGRMQTEAGQAMLADQMARLPDMIRKAMEEADQEGKEANEEEGPQPSGSRSTEQPALSG